MAKIFLSLCVLALFLHGSIAEFRSSNNPWQSSREGAQNQCRFERLTALEPKRRVQSEGGVTEYFDENNETFNCSGVAVIRKTIQPQGLTLPIYFNAHHLIYVVKGRGIAGEVVPGCPETYQSSSGQQQQEQGQQQQCEKQDHQQQKHGQGQQQSRSASNDLHQRIIRVQQADILAVPAGIAHWCYNDGDSPLVLIAVLDTSNNANQLDNNPDKFSLSGQTSEQDESSANNIFRGFNQQLLGDALGVSRELAKKLQHGKNGEIIRVQGGLKVVMPPNSDSEEQQEEREYESRQFEGRQDNGLEQAFCTLRFKENIDMAWRADVYNPEAGLYSQLNGRKLPILNFIQMSAARGLLFRGATLAPNWNINAHTVLYVTGGRGRIQIVGNQGRSVFDDELCEGQMVVKPQYFVVVIQARDEQFEWVSFKTHGNAIANQIIGPGSFFRRNYTVCRSHGAPRQRGVHAFAAVTGPRCARRMHARHVGGRTVRPAYGIISRSSEGCQRMSL